jgi:RNA polymerase sigma factor (TIGR02999 family)
MNSYITRPEESAITHCLHEWRSGSREAENKLFGLVFPNLCRLASYILRAERGTHDLEPRDLVNQAYLRLAAAKDRDWQGRRHFFAVALLAMRRHVIDCARKRRKVQSVALEDEAKASVHDSADLDVMIRVRNLLDQLALISPNWRLIVELKYYVGLTDRETAERMGIKLRTMQRTLTAVRQWLRERAAGGRELKNTRGRTPGRTREGRAFVLKTRQTATQSTE